MESEKTPPPDNLPQARKRPPWRGVCLCVVAFAAIFWLLRETYSVALPSVSALLLALAVWPVVQPIRDRMPKHLKWAGAATGLLIVLLFLTAFLVGLSLALQQIYDLGRNLEPQFREWIGALPLSVIFTDGPDPDSQSLVTRGGLASRALTTLGVTANAAGGVILILFLMLLMLTEADRWHQKMLAVTGPGGDRRWLNIGRSVGGKFRAYFTTRFILGLVTAVLYVGWLAAFDVDYLLLWGVLAVLLNFIPTVGSIIAGTLPVIYVLITRDPLSAAIVGGGLLVIEQVMGNFVDPKIMGRRLSISPLIVLVALLFWTILWGIAGAFLAVPLTVLITMVMAHFERLQPAALLLTDCATLEELEEYRQAQ